MATRKDNGDGSIYQVTPTKWVAKIYLGKKENGKPDYKSFSGKTEVIAKRKLREFKKERGLFVNVQSSGVTVKEYMERWLDLYKRDSLKPSSFDRLESTVKTHIIPAIGGIQFSALAQDDIQVLVKKLSKDGKSYSSIKKVCDAINSCYVHAIIKGDVEKNPRLGIKIPISKSSTEKEIIIFSEEEIKAIKKEADRRNVYGKHIGAKKYIYGDAYTLILNTGLRIGEVTALKWSDIDFDKKQLTVNGNVVMIKNRDSNGKSVKGYTLISQNSAKTKAGSGRVIQLNNNAICALKNLKVFENQEYVVVNSKNINVAPHSFSKTFYQILSKAELNECGVHALRHTFASMLFKKGIDIKTISSILGHSSVQVTYDIYVHIIDEQKAKAVEKLDDI